MKNSIFFCFFLLPRNELWHTSSLCVLLRVASVYIGGKKIQPWYFFPSLSFSHHHWHPQPAYPLLFLLAHSRHAIEAYIRYDKRENTEPYRPDNFFSILLLFLPSSSSLPFLIILSSSCSALLCRWWFLICSTHNKKK